MTTTRWIMNTGWTAVSFTASELNTLASGGGALSTTTISNGTALDQYADVSFSVTVGGTTVAGSYMTIFLLPLNQDGSTFGADYASSTTSQPVVSYSVGSVGAKVGVGSGSTITGMLQFINLPPGDFRLAIANNLQVALGSTAGLIMKYRTYNTSLT